MGTDNQYSTTAHPSHHHHGKFYFVIFVLKFISTFVGIGGGDMKTSTDRTSRPAEQAYPASGVTGTGYGTSSLFYI